MLMPTSEHSVIIEVEKIDGGGAGGNVDTEETNVIDDTTCAHVTYEGFVNVDDDFGRLRGVCGGGGGSVIPVVAEFLEMLGGDAQNADRCLHAPVLRKSCDLKLC